MRLAYVILLPDDVHNFMRAVQAGIYDRYEASATTFGLEPHVTLKQPFETEELERHERYLDRLAAELDTFEIVTRGYGFFEEERVVFIDVEQDPRLLSIQHRILDELGLAPAEYESGEPVPYHFHGTLAQGLSPSDFGEVRARLSGEPKFRFPLERLGLFRGTEDGWTVYKRVRLA